MLMSDIRYGYKSLIKSLIIFICILAVPVIVTVASQGAMGKIEEWVSAWPPELWALCGATNMMSSKLNIMPFYMILIIANIIAMCRCASSASLGMVNDMENGKLKLYINQPYNRNEVFFMKLSVAIVSALIQWLIYCCIIAVAVSVLCSMFGLSAGNELEGIYDIAIRGIVIVILLLSICLLYNMNSDRGMTNASFLTVICSVSLFGGNIYKIFELIGYYMRRLQGDDSTIVFVGEVLEKFRVLYPFTLLNVLNTEKQPLVGGIYIVYILVALVAFALCRYIYGKKNFA